MADGIIGSVGVSVVPDANDFWRRFQEQTSTKAVKAGEQSGRDWRRGFDAATKDTTVKVKADTTQARAQVAALKKDADTSSGGFNKLITAALALAPAIVPIGVAASGAAVELGTLGATGILAFRGIKTEMANATPLGNEYSGILHTLKGDLNDLSAISARGVLSGFQGSVKDLQAEMPHLNELIRTQSVLLGQTVEHLSGGLIGGFNTFAPMLNQIGQSVDRVAGRFELWATGPGGAKFGEVLQADYAKVAPIVDDIGHTLARVAAASNGVGLGILTELQVLSNVVSSFPTPVLETIVLTFTAFKQAQLATGIINGISGAFGRLNATASAAASRMNAASLSIRATAATEAAAIAESQAAEAEAVATAQAQIAASLAGTGSILEETAATAATTSAEEAAAFRAAATEASVAAAQIAAAAETEAAAGRAATAGLGGLLGPVGLVVGGVLALATAFGHSSDATKAETQAMSTFYGILKDTNGALTDASRAKLTEQLVTSGATAIYGKFGISARTLTDAVLGNKSAIEQVTAVEGKAGLASGLLHKVLGDLTTGYSSAQDEIKQVAQSTDKYGLTQAQANIAVNQGSAAFRSFAAAIDTFSSSEDTAADRAALMGATLVAANGDLLGYAHTMVAAAVANQQLVTDFANLKKGVLDLKTGTIDYHNAAAGPLINDLQALQTAAENAASATYQHELATRSAKQAADDAFAVYQNDTKGALKDEAQQLGLTSIQAGKLADKYFGLKNSGDIKKKIELLGEDKVTQFLKGILADLDLLVDKAGKATLKLSQVADLGGGVHQVAGGAGTQFQASGGYISGPGSGTSDSIPAWLSNGEFVVNSAQTSRHLPLLHAINSGAQGFADGGEVGGFSGVDTTGLANKYGVDKKAKAAKKPEIDYFVLGIDYSSLKAAENAAKRAFKAQVNLGVKIDGTDLDKFKASLKGTADQAHAAFVTIYNDAKKLGISKGLATELRDENTELDKEINARDKLAASYKAVVAKFKDEKATIKSAITGSFDIGSAGTGFDGNQPVTGGNILAEEKQAEVRAKEFVADVKKLAGKLNPVYLKQLAEKGPDALPQAKALLSLSAGQLKTLNADASGLYAAGNDLGDYEANRLYGGTIAKDKRELALDNASIDKLAAKMSKQFEHAVDELSHRPIVIKVDGKVIAQVTATGANANARRS